MHGAESEGGSVAPGRSVAVIGAGLSGLSAAYRLQRQGWRVCLLEASDHVGGRVQTVERDGYRIDTGASAFAQSYRSYLRLLDELGMRDAVAPVAPAVGIVRDRHIHLLHTDRMLRSGLATRLLSWPAKLKLLRLAVDLLLAIARKQLDYSDMRRAAPLDDQTAREYALRTLSAEIDAYLGDPIARTMLITDTDQVSKVELFSGLANIMSNRLYALRGGQGRLPQVLAAGLQPRLNTRVTCVREQADGVEVAYSVAGGTEQVEHFDACVVTCPLPIAAEICVDQQALLQPLQQALRYTQALTVAVATRRPPDCPAFLIQLPSCEDADIALMFLEHNKCADRVPPGCGLIGVDWEAQASSRYFHSSDEEIGAHTLRSVFALFPELREQIAFVHVTRWAAALPWTRVGAYRLIGEFNAALDPASRVQFAADYMSAAGQNTAVEFGERAAAQLLARFARS